MKKSNLIGVDTMTDKQTAALLEAVNIIIKLSPTKQDAERYIKQIQEQMKKPATVTNKD